MTRLPGGDGDYLYGIVDWPPAMRYGYDVRTVARTTENVLAADGFRKTAALAAIAGDSATQAADADRAAALTVAINQRLRRPDGVFVDGLEADGSQSPTRRSRRTPSCSRTRLGSDPRRPPVPPARTWRNSGSRRGR